MAAGGSADHLIEAHHGAAQRLEVALGRDGLLPAPALEVVLDDIVVIGIEVAGQEILEDAAEELGEGLLAENLRKLVGSDVEGLAHGPEVVGDKGLEPVAPLASLCPRHEGSESFIRCGGSHVSALLRRSPADHRKKLPPLAGLAIRIRFFVMAGS